MPVPTFVNASVPPKVLFNRMPLKVEFVPSVPTSRVVLRLFAELTLPLPLNSPYLTRLAVV